MVRAGRVGACVLCALAALSCGQVSSNKAVPKDAGGDSAAVADAGDAAATDAGDGSATDAGTGSWQKWCEPGMVNDPQCPADQPNGACPVAGLQCAYPESSGVALADCADQGAGTALWWVLTGVTCSYDCAALADAGAGTAVGGAACDSRPTVACDPTAYRTNQTTLDGQLEAIAQDCGVGKGVHAIWVGFDHGCATRVVGATGSVATCMAGKLATQRFDCALELACGVAEYALP